MFSLEHLNAIRAAEIDKVAGFLPSGARILELGAGTGIQARALAERGFAVQAIELADSLYSGDRVFPIADYDGITIPFEDARFDVVFSSNVLEHIPNLERVNSEISRVLKPDGCAVHLLPTTAWRFWTTLSAFADVVVVAQQHLRKDLRDRSLQSHARHLTCAGRATLGALRYALMQKRHGERGGVITELYYFSRSWWLREFSRAGYRLVHDQPMGLFYTGNVVFGSRFAIADRARAAYWLGSACRLYKLAPPQSRGCGIRVRDSIAGSAMGAL
jgi:SAM-dependent methyltransferase